MMQESSPFPRSRETFYRNNTMKFDSKLESKRHSNPVSAEKISEKSIPLEQETLRQNPTIMEDDEYNFNSSKLLQLPAGAESPQIEKRKNLMSGYQHFIRIPNLAPLPHLSSLKSPQTAC